MRTYKKQLNFAAVGTAVQTQDVMVTGVDSTALGQTTAVDPNVPTGSQLSGFRIQFGVGNVGGTVIEFACNVQYTLAAQAAIDPLLVGGNAQRNQVIKSWHFMLAPNEMRNIDTFVKLPKKMKRVRESQSWLFVKNSNAARTEGNQVIYKVRL